MLILIEIVTKTTVAAGALIAVAYADSLIGSCEQQVDVVVQLQRSSGSSWYVIVYEHRLVAGIEVGIVCSPYLSLRDIHDRHGSLHESPHQRSPREVIPGYIIFECEGQLEDVGGKVCTQSCIFFGSPLPCTRPHG